MTGLAHNHAHSLDLLRMQYWAAAKETTDLHAAERNTAQIEGLLFVIRPLPAGPARCHCSRAFIRSRACGMQAAVVTLEPQGASKGIQHGRVFHTN